MGHFIWRFSKKTGPCKKKGISVAHPALKYWEIALGISDQAGVEFQFPMGRGGCACVTTTAAGTPHDTKQKASQSRTPFIFASREPHNSSLSRVNSASHYRTSLAFPQKTAQRLEIPTRHLLKSILRVFSCLCRLTVLPFSVMRKRKH